MMNPEVKAKWVAALRSGYYEQTKSVLTVGDGKTFCCLGVLCDISGVGQWENVSERDPEDDDSSTPRYMDAVEHDAEIPPALVCDWAGFPGGTFHSDRVPTVDIGGKVLPLHEHNDEGATFAQLADAIEEQL